MSQRGVYEKVPGSGEWWIRYADTSGRIRREKVGTKTSATALYRKRKTHVLEGRKLPEKLRSAAVAFEVIAQHALEYSRATKVADAYKIDCYHMKTLRSWFGTQPANSITPQHIEQRLATLAEEEGLKPATLNRYRALLSLVFSRAVLNGKLDTNPVRQVKRRKENNERVRFLDEVEETALRATIRVLHPKGESEFDLALHTGMRRGEQYRLRWQDVDLKNGILTITRSKHGEARRIQINSVASEALLKLRAQANGIGYVCPGLQGPREKDRRRWFDEVLKQSGVQNFRWHDLRHTFASRLVMAGVPLRAIQTLLGHKRLETTLRYAHLAEAHLHQAVERLVPAKRTDTTTSTELGSASVSQKAISA